MAGGQLTQSVFEFAIIEKDWNKLYKLWPQLKIKECSFPVNVHYFIEEINENARILIYIFNIEDEQTFQLAQSIIPYLPFCLKIVENLDAQFRSEYQFYQQNFETPLFLILSDEDDLKSKIAQLSKADMKLPEVIVLEKGDTENKSIRMLIRSILEKLNLPTASAEKATTHQEPSI